MQSPQSRRNDISIFLVLIPVINLFNYFVTYNNISFNTRTLLTFTIDTVEGYIAWFAVHRIIRFLDVRMPYTQNIVKRLVVQLVTTVSAAMLIIIALTYLLNVAFTNQPLPHSFFAFDIFIISVWFIVMNGIYIALYFYHEWKAAEFRRMEDNKIKLAGFTVKTGKQELQLPFETIAGFWVDGEYVCCNTLSEKKYLTDHSIDRLEKAMPASLFFRLNRQFLVHRQVIAGFERSENGKLNVLIKSMTNLPGTITVSRTKASEFKAWFRPD